MKEHSLGPSWLLFGAGLAAGSCLACAASYYAMRSIRLAEAAASQAQSHKRARSVANFATTCVCWLDEAHPAMRVACSGAERCPLCVALRGRFCLSDALLPEEEMPP